MARRSITRYGPKGGVYHEHVNVGGGSSGGCGCILFIAAAVLVVAVVGGLIMMAVSGTDWYGVPRGSHNALTMTSTCQDWSAEKDAMGAGQEAAFFTAHVRTTRAMRLASPISVFPRSIGSAGRTPAYCWRMPSLAASCSQKPR
jgi:hypothetical protein